MRVFFRLCALAALAVPAVVNAGVRWEAEDFGTSGVIAVSTADTTRAFGVSRFERGYAFVYAGADSFTLKVQGSFNSVNWHDIKSLTVNSDETPALHWQGCLSFEGTDGDSVDVIPYPLLRGIFNNSDATDATTAASFQLKLIN